MTTFTIGPLTFSWGQIRAEGSATADNDGVGFAVFYGLFFWGIVFVTPWLLVLAVAFTVHNYVGWASIVGSVFYGWYLGRMLVRYSLFRVKEGVKEDEAPQVALPTLRGKYLPQRLKGSGYRFFFPPFPTYYRAIMININKRNQEIPVMVRTNPETEGAEAKLVLAFTWVPDYKQPSRLPRFLLYRDSGIAEQLEDVAGKHGIDVAADKGWKDLYKNLGEVADKIVNDITERPDVTCTEKLAELEPEDGDSDKFGWGIRIVRVRPQSITLTGKMGQLAEKLALEFQERQGELEDQQTVERLVDIIAGKDTGKAERDDARRLIMLARAQDGQAALAHATLALRKELAEVIIRFFHKPS